MRKVLDFKTYSSLRSMSLNDMNRWVMSVYESAYRDGYAEASKGQVVIDEDSLYELLLSISGVGPKTAGKVIRALKERQI